MKNLFLNLSLTVLLSILSVCVYSQSSINGSETSEKKKHNVWYGLRAGTDLTTPTTDFNEIKNHFDSNMQFGVFMKIGKKVFLQPEVYGQLTPEYSAFGKEMKLNGIKVPILLGFELLELGIARAHFMAGPATTMNWNNPDHKFQFKLQMGGGVDILRFISLDVRYSVNLNDNIKDEINQLSLKSGVNVTLGIQFR